VTSRLRERETCTTGKEITFQLRSPAAPGVYGRGAVNDIRGGRRRADGRAALTIQHIFGLSVFRRDARVIAVECRKVG